MTKEELIDLAKTCEEAILTNELTKSELVMLAGLLHARLMSKVFGGEKEPSRSPVQNTSPTPPAPVPLKPKAIKYDPMYDPAPPMVPEAPPPLPQPTGKVLATAGTACVCDACRKVVYIVNKDILDNCKVSVFRESFTPTSGTPELPTTAEIQNIDGNISTDCVLCGASKSLYLIGRSAR